jgi:hypothetical protein
MKHAAEITGGSNSRSLISDLLWPATIASVFAILTL